MKEFLQDMPLGLIKKYAFSCSEIMPLGTSPITIHDHNLVAIHHEKTHNKDGKGKERS